MGNKRYPLALIEVIFLLILINLVSAQYSTSLEIFDSEQDEEAQTQSNNAKVLAGEWVTFYANYSSDDGFNLGQVLWRNNSDLTDGYLIRAIDFYGTGNKTGIVYSVADNIYAFYGNNGTQKWKSYNTEFDYAYGMETYDFNNDSLEEVAFMSSGGRMFILNGTNGSIIFQTADYTTGYTLGTGDLDLDGRRDDIVIGVSNLPSPVDTYSLLAFIYNETSISFQNIWNKTEPTNVIYEIKISEIVREQSLIAVQDGSGGKALIYYGNGTLNYNSGDLGTAYAIALFDQDSDGKEDEYAISLSTGNLRVWRSDNSSLPIITEPFGTEYEISKVDLDLDGIYDDLLVSSNYNTLFAYNSDLTLAWQFNPPHKEFESLYYYTTAYLMYPLNVLVRNVNNDSLDEIIVGGYGSSYWILNVSGNIIGKHYYGFESDDTNGEYIGTTYANSPGIDVLNDTNGDGFPEIALARGTGFVSVSQQVICKINITGHYREEYMYYNYTSKLYEYYYPLDYSVMEGVQDNKIINWTVKCEKGGYESQEVTENFTAYTKNSSLDVFDEEDDSEDKAGWLSETTIIQNQNTYFFANYTDLEINAPVTDITTKPEWYKDIGAGTTFYDLIAADFDGDGKKESFVYSTLDAIFAYSAEGELLWSSADPNYEIIYDLTSGDFNNDSYDEIAGVGSLGYVIILDKNGNQIYPYNNFQTGYTIVKGDLNDDGVPDIVAGVGDVFGAMGTKYGIVAISWNFSTSSFQVLWRANDTTLFYPVEIKITEIPNAPNRVAYVDYTGAEKAYVYYGNGTFIYNTSALATAAASLDFLIIMKMEQLMI